MVQIVPTVLGNYIAIESEPEEVAEFCRKAGGHPFKPGQSFMSHLGTGVIKGIAPAGSLHKMFLRVALDCNGGRVSLIFGPEIERLQPL